MKTESRKEYKTVPLFKLATIKGGNTYIPPWLAGVIPLLLSHWGDIKLGFRDGINDYRTR